MIAGMLHILGWTLGAVFALLLGAGVAGFAVLWALSPGKAQPIVDADGVEIPGSISTIERITLGGLDQGLIIRGVDATAPVMLFLHGGPGSPEYPALRRTNLGLEDDFVMVYWEQRGAGMSFPGVTPEDLSLEKMVADTAELAAKLAVRFGQDKVFLMGHSWGSLLGMSTIRQHPELFHAYFGLGNVANQYAGEKLALDWARRRAEELGNPRAAAALAGLSLPGRDADGGDWKSYLLAQRRWLDQVGGGITHGGPGMATVMLWTLRTPEYRMRDKLNFFRGAMFSLDNLWRDVMEANLIETAGPIDIPVFFLQGAWDYQTPTPLARALFEATQAPVKEYVEFDNSAHSPIMEEPEKFNAFVRAAALQLE